MSDLNDFYSAVKVGNLPTIKSILSSFLNPGRDWPSIFSPLNDAIIDQNWEIVDYFLNFPNLDINYIDKADEFALVRISWRDPPLPIFEKLLNYPGVQVNQQTPSSQWTALHSACTDGKIEIVRCLLSHPEIIIDQSDITGKKPIDYAREKNHPEIVKLLEDWKKPTTLLPPCPPVLLIPSPPPVAATFIPTPSTRSEAEEIRQFKETLTEKEKQIKQLEDELNDWKMRIQALEKEKREAIETKDKEIKDLKGSLVAVTREKEEKVADH